MARSKQIQVGDRVAYSVQWLRSIGCYSGDLPQARGVVTGIQQRGGLELATVDWGTEDIPARVLISNLAIVGPNTRFCNC